MEKLLLSPSEAAAHLSVGRSKVYELMRLGQLRSVKIGGSRRIPRAALTDFVADARAPLDSLRALIAESAVGDDAQSAALPPNTLTVGATLTIAGPGGTAGTYSGWTHTLTTDP